MRSKSANTLKTNVRLTKRNKQLCNQFLGGFSEGVNKGIEMLMLFNITVYMIRHKFEKRCFVGVYVNQEVPDIAYHYVNDLGSETLGHQIRQEGPGFFEFYVIGKFTDIKEASAVKKMFRKMYQKAGYTPLNKGVDITD
jgi:hypothetical protein